jgi:hypothetical protein
MLDPAKKKEKKSPVEKPKKNNDSSKKKGKKNPIEQLLENKIQFHKKEKEEESTRAQKKKDVPKKPHQDLVNSLVSNVTKKVAGLIEKKSTLAIARPEFKKQLEGVVGRAPQELAKKPPVNESPSLINTHTPIEIQKNISNQAESAPSIPHQEIVIESSNLKPSERAKNTAFLEQLIVSKDLKTATRDVKDPNQRYLAMKKTSRNIVSMAEPAPDASLTELRSSLPENTEHSKDRSPAPIKKLDSSTIASFQSLFKQRTQSVSEMTISHDSNYQKESTAPLSENPSPQASVIEEELIAVTPSDKAKMSAFESLFNQRSSTHPSPKMSNHLKNEKESPDTLSENPSAQTSVIEEELIAVTPSDKAKMSAFESLFNQRSSTHPSPKMSNHLKNEKESPDTLSENPSPQASVIEEELIAVTPSDKAKMSAFESLFNQRSSTHPSPKMSNHLKNEKESPDTLSENPSAQTSVIEEELIAVRPSDKAKMSAFGLLFNQCAKRCPSMVVTEPAEISVSDESTDKKDTSISLTHR